MKKLMVVLIPVFILIGISGVLSIYCYEETKKITSYFEGDTISSTLEIVENQKVINKKLEDISNDRSYTFHNAYVDLNPYQISPLSAIIIFSTNQESEVTVTINDKSTTKTNKTKKHIIPIYGLYEDFANKIKLTMDGEEQIYTIQTEKSNIEYPLEVLEKSNTLNNEDIYFTVASYATWLTGWDTDGKLRFYLTEDFRMDVEWLENGHFIIGTTQGQFAENFLGFVEMDYLGKIYNYYTMENGFSFESQILSNGNIMSAGGSTPVYIKEQVIYEMNPKTGEKISDVNLAKLFKSIDPDFPDKYLGQAAVRNGFYYNEDNHEMIVSFRGIDTIFCLDYQKKELKWIFTSPDNELFQKDVWKDYLVKSKRENYPWGQHSPQITSEGYIAFFNNGYNRYHGFEVGGEDKVIKYKDNYSRAEVYEIKDKKAKLVWSYDEDKKIFSHQYGSIHVSEDNHKLVNFGYVLKDEYRQNENATLSASEQNPDNIYSYIIEVDEKDNVLFKAKCEEGKYRVFKHNLYNSTTQIEEIATLNTFNTIKPDELIEEKNKTYSFDNLQEWIYNLKFTKNTFETNYDIQENDEIKLYFVNKTGKVYILNYKERENPNKKRIFNVELNNGEYSFYIEINGILYDPKTNIKF